MSKNDVFKSKEFRDKESKLRENLRLSNAQELIGDFVRLLEEKLFCDVTFTVEDDEFSAHVSILQARAPKFSKDFLPNLSSPSVQSCINIHNLQSDKFAGFLRSVYAENVVQDYSEVDYPCTESPLVKNMKNEFEDSLDDCEDVQNKQSENDEVSNANDNNLQTQTKCSSIDACCKIGQDLINLVNDSKSSDITFTLNDNQKVKAHRAILCARSNYFSVMLFGDWSEKEATEIPLLGISHQAFLVVLYFLYGGITNIPLDNANDICDVLYLADMYGLEGLKEVVICELKLMKCHLFHKPCPECLAGVLECLEVSEVFQLEELQKQCLKWTVRYFDRVYSTKSFGYLSQKLQEIIQSALQSSINRLNVIDLLCRGDKVASSLPPINWSKPVLDLVYTSINSCLSFIAENFHVVVSDQSFRNMLKGVGWSTPLLEKIFTALWNSLNVQNCCERFKVTMRLRNEMARSDCEGDTSEEVDNLIEKLHTRCQNFIVSNLHRVSHTDGWKHLSPRTQTEIRKSEGGMFVDVGLPSQRNRTFPASSKSLSNSLRPSSTKRPLSQAGPPSRNQKTRAKSAGIPTSAQEPKSGKPAVVNHKRPGSAASSSTSLRQTRSAASTSFSKPPTGSRNSVPRTGLRETSTGNKKTTKGGESSKSGIACAASSKTAESCSKSMLVDKNVDNAIHCGRNTKRKSMPVGASNMSSTFNTTRKSMSAGASNLSTRVNTTRKSLPAGVSNLSSSLNTTKASMSSRASTSSSKENTTRRSLPAGVSNLSSSNTTKASMSSRATSTSSSKENTTRRSLPAGVSNLSSSLNTTRVTMSSRASTSSTSRVSTKRKSMPAGAGNASSSVNTTKRTVSAGARNTSSKTNTATESAAKNVSVANRTINNHDRQSAAANVNSCWNQSNKKRPLIDTKRSQLPNVSKSSRVGSDVHGSSKVHQLKPGENEKRITNVPKAKAASCKNETKKRNEMETKSEVVSLQVTKTDQVPSAEATLGHNGANVTSSINSSLAGENKMSDKVDSEGLKSEEYSHEVADNLSDTLSNMALSKSDVNSPIKPPGGIRPVVYKDEGNIETGVADNLSDTVPNMALSKSSVNSPLEPSVGQQVDYKDEGTLDTEMAELSAAEWQEHDTSSSSNTAVEIANTTWTIESGDCTDLGNNIQKETTETENCISQEYVNTSLNTADDDANITWTAKANLSVDCYHTGKDVIEKNAGAVQNISSTMAPSKLGDLNRTNGGGGDDGTTVARFESEAPTVELSTRSNDTRQDNSQDSVSGNHLSTSESRNDKNEATKSFCALEHEQEDTVSN